MQLGHDRRQRRAHDRLVEGRQEHGQQDRDQDLGPGAGVDVDGGVHRLRGGGHALSPWEFARLKAARRARTDASSCSRSGSERWVRAVAIRSRRLSWSSRISAAPPSERRSVTTRRSSLSCWRSTSPRSSMRETIPVAAGKAAAQELGDAAHRQRAVRVEQGHEEQVGHADGAGVAACAKAARSPAMIGPARRADLRQHFSCRESFVSREPLCRDEASRATVLAFSRSRARTASTATVVRVGRVALEQPRLLAAGLGVKEGGQTRARRRARPGSR